MNEMFPLAGLVRPPGVPGFTAGPNWLGIRETNSGGSRSAGGFIASVRVYMKLTTLRIAVAIDASLYGSGGSPTPSAVISSGMNNVGLAAVMVSSSK